jgi:hypothetical protein
MYWRRWDPTVEHLVRQHSPEAKIFMAARPGVTAGRQGHLAAAGERRLQGFKSPGHAQRFLSASGPITQHFRLRRHLFHAPEYRQELGKRFYTWQDITSLPTAA